MRPDWKAWHQIWLFHTPENGAIRAHQHMVNCGSPKKNSEIIEKYI
jgi:hypothetical protein